MKTTLFTILLIAWNASAFEALVYDRTSSPVTNRALYKLVSLSELPALPTNYSALIYSRKASMSNWNGVLPNVPLNWCKVSNNLVAAMTAAESNSIITSEALAQTIDASNKLFSVQTAAKNSTTNDLMNFYGSSVERRLNAFMALCVDEFNVVRTNPAAVLSVRTLAQLTNALKVKIDAQANNVP